MVPDEKLLERLGPSSSVFPSHFGPPQVAVLGGEYPGQGYYEQPGHPPHGDERAGGYAQEMGTWHHEAWFF